MLTPEKRITTCVACPYAMVVSNGAPKLAFLTDFLVTDRTYCGHRMNRHWSKPNWAALFKTRMAFPEGKVIRQWRHPPSRQAVKTAAEAYNKRQRRAA